MAATLHIQTFCLGDWMTNCFVIHKHRSPGEAASGVATPAPGPCWIVDAGQDPGEMIRYIRENGLKPEAVVLTHAHFDHIAGLEEVCRQWPGIPVWLAKAEHEFLLDPMLNLSAAVGGWLVAPPATGVLEHGQELELEGVVFEVRATPGHSPGGITLYQRQAEVAVVGDALFRDSIGRHDFPTSDYQALMRSIHTQLLTLPDATKVYPGHGPGTTIGRERQANPYLQVG
ncbi:MAG: MBL fold metallo-hydrolase [Phycisphaeraceae bacterium]|nr:MBL fold metallo-hydrolase [Phycisphaeraceae bacterium]